MRAPTHRSMCNSGPGAAGDYYHDTRGGKITMSGPSAMDAWRSATSVAALPPPHTTSANASTPAAYAPRPASPAATAKRPPSPSQRPPSPSMSHGGLGWGACGPCQTFLDSCFTLPPPHGKRAWGWSSFNWLLVATLLYLLKHRCGKAQRNVATSCSECSAHSLLHMCVCVCVQARTCSLRHLVHASSRPRCMGQEEGAAFWMGWRMDSR